MRTVLLHDKLTTYGCAWLWHLPIHRHLLPCSRRADWRLTPVNHTMTKTKLGDIIKELRGAATFALLLCAAWSLFSTTYSQTLSRREMASDLLAYLLLRDA